MKMDKKVFDQLCLTALLVLAGVGALVGGYFVIMVKDPGALTGGVVAVLSGLLFMVLVKKFKAFDNQSSQKNDDGGRMAITDLLLVYSWVFMILGVLTGGYCILFKVGASILILGGILIMLGIFLGIAVLKMRRVDASQQSQKKIIFIFSCLLSVAALGSGLYLILFQVENVKVLFNGFLFIIGGIFLAAFIRMFSYIGQMIHELKEVLITQSKCRKDQLEILYGSIWDFQKNLLDNMQDNLQKELRTHLTALRDNQLLIKDYTLYSRDELVQIKKDTQLIRDGINQIRSDTSLMEQMRVNLELLKDNSEYIRGSNEEIKNKSIKIEQDLERSKNTLLELREDSDQMREDTILIRDNTDQIGDNTDVLREDLIRTRDRCRAIVEENEKIRIRVGDMQSNIEQTRAFVVKMQAYIWDMRNQHERIKDDVSQLKSSVLRTLKDMDESSKNVQIAARGMDQSSRRMDGSSQQMSENVGEIKNFFKVIERHLQMNVEDGDA